jgi:hypothetical protein
VMLICNLGEDCRVAVLIEPIVGQDEREESSLLEHGGNK